MNNLLQLFLTFMKIGAFSFGGGYAMISFFEKEIAFHQWTQAGDYTKMIAIAQVFPGPFAIDSSAYIGFKVGGMWGAVIASLALSLPSFLALVIITRFYIQFKANKYISLVLTGVRPVVIGLLISAAYVIGFKPVLSDWTYNTASVVMVLKAITTMGIGFLLLKYTKLNPIMFIILFGVIGIVLF